MDPCQLHEDLVEYCKKVRRIDEDKDPTHTNHAFDLAALALKMTDRFLALDNWLSCGGFLPRTWIRNLP